MCKEHHIFNEITQSISKMLEYLFPTPKQYYPVLVGWDGNRIVPRLVNEEFREVCANFAVCYNVQIGLTKDDDIIAYRFSIQRKTDSLPDEVLQVLIQRQTEQILTETMQTYNCYISAEPLTVVELRKHDLMVGFARTPDGITKIDTMKQNIMIKQNRKKQEHTSSTFTENWNE